MEEKFIEVIEMFKEKTEKECYKIELSDGEPSILDDKIGGKPYLPVGEEYPKDKDGNNLALLLQVNLSNIDLEGYPKKGILEIFVDCNLDYPCQYAVKYFNEGLEYQTELPEVDLSNFIVRQAYKIKLSKDKCYMALNDYRTEKIICEIVNKVYGVDVNDLYDINDYLDEFDWYEKIYDECMTHRITLGGYPDFTQDDPRNHKIENKDECLFKLDSCANSRVFNIGDSGILFALISQSEIEKCDFEKAIVDWDCC